MKEGQSLGKSKSPTRKWEKKKKGRRKGEKEKKEKRRLKEG